MYVCITLIKRKFSTAGTSRLPNILRIARISPLLLARVIDTIVTCVSGGPVAHKEMAVETRRIDCLIAAELSLTCGAGAL
jgi:hypothetical protein